MEQLSVKELESVCSAETRTLVPAVLVQNARKSYSTGESVLNNLSMRVETGSIYGLLGASGCGKTTLLSAIVGLKHLDSGSVHVFGYKPGTPESGIPGGRTLGYMPQEIALYEMLTISDICHYFGTMCEMSRVDVEARIEFLIEFLDLPDSGMLIKNLSGGQQRRVSLAITMLHRPKLLILDEPTVGLDPLLRQSIWTYLEQMVAKQGITIIVTTHYIQEADSFGKVGIMRGGRLLVEDSPKNLLNKYNTPFLEQVLLQLCAADEANTATKMGPTENIDYSYFKKLRKTALPEQNEVKNNISGISYRSSDTTNNNDGFVNDKDVVVTPKNEDLSFVENISNNASKVFALMRKTFLFLFRTPWFAVCILLIPAMQIVSFLLLLGHDPKHVVMGIVHHEKFNDSTNLMDYCKTIPTDKCFPPGVICRYLNNFPADEFQWIEYNSDKEALQGVQNGKTWGYMSIPVNYTQHMLDRSLAKNYAENDTIDGSTIISRLDMSFRMKSDFIQVKAHQYFEKYLTDLAATCDSDPNSVQAPLKFHAIYGSLGSTFQPYIQPGFIVLTIILIPMACALRFIQDRKAGTLQRSIVSGLKYSHTFMELLISDGIILFVQVGFCHFILVNVGGITGITWQYFVLVFLEGVVGLTIGFLAGQAVDDEIQAVYIILGCYLPLLFCSGAMLPFEGMSHWAKIIYSASPTALPIKSLRSMITRGWGVSHPKVWPGFAMAIFWIVGMSLLSILIRKIRNK